MHACFMHCYQAELNPTLHFPHPSTLANAKPTKPYIILKAIASPCNCDFLCKNQPSKPADSALSNF